MKKLIVLSMALCVFNASAKMGSLDKVEYAGDLSYKDFCEAVIKDDVNMLKVNVIKKVGVVASNKQAVLKKLTAANGMECNGFDLLSFSEQRKSSKVYEYLSNAK